MANSSLIHEFRAYGAWRAALCQRIDAYRRWLTGNDLGDAQADLRLQQLVERLAEDRLVVAFVAEHLNGKSELINAIFFADGSRPLLPPIAAGTPTRTICPTELLYDRGKPPRIELLPIETRATRASSTEFKRFPEEWRVIPLDTQSADTMLRAYTHVNQTKRVPAEDARRYGLWHPGASGNSAPSGDGTVEVPCWRHAVINFPHPLLEQGLVILDTPGLNNIGADLELTLSTLPNAHAVLLVAAADAGITSGDLALWREQIVPRRGRFAVLNKIDGLWDDLGSDAQTGVGIAEQIDDCSRLLELDAARVFPVSAQRGLLAKISGDDALLARSGLPQLEHALATELIPARHEIMGALVRAEIQNMTNATRSRLEARRRNVLDQLQKLEYLRGKNRSMIGVMMQKVGSEKESFARELASYQALRGVLSAHTDRMYTHLGMDALSDDWRRAREEMRRSIFTPGVRSAMTRFFRNVRTGLEHSAEQVAEISTLMAAMYRKFSDEHGLRLTAPPPFSMLRYLKEIDRLEKTYQRRFNTLVAMLTTEKLTLMQKFFETLASQVKRCYGYANREADLWLQAIMAPMDTQVREHQMQLRRRLESIKRIHQATDTLEDRIEELLAVERGVRSQLDALEKRCTTLEEALEFRAVPLAQAA